ncbi:eukaryotic translation initiation factor 3 subunit D [Puccinia sorghi]|uniref:Eukaryotic translation initiation factor 3 subunit D n=1 Tax=Puccinia sorghi TaxID=27349 RepID=A0A0L6V2N6_9BASI|nr:eukaryotic translation initiation factor 3 subunit D [Puccinia sorghi]
MKNNSCKLAKWAVQSILAGADQMKMGYYFLLFLSPPFLRFHGLFNLAFLIPIRYLPPPPPS